MATEIEPLIMPFDPLWVTTSKREYREAVRRMGEEPGDTKGKDGLAVPHKVVNEPLYYLSQSLAKMACCDAVFLCEGWENARGCRVERAAAVAYDLEIIGHDIPCTGGAR